MRYFLFVFYSALVLFLISCGRKKENVDIIVRGKYLYVDKGGCLHSTNKCTKMMFSEDPNVYGLIRIDTLDIKLDDFEYSCSKCVDDKTYEWIVGLTKNNNKQLAE